MFEVRYCTNEGKRQKLTYHIVQFKDKGAAIQLFDALVASVNTFNIKLENKPE